MRRRANSARSLAIRGTLANCHDRRLAYIAALATSRFRWFGNADHDPVSPRVNRAIAVCRRASGRARSRLLLDTLKAWKRESTPSPDSRRSRRFEAGSDLIARSQQNRAGAVDGVARQAGACRDAVFSTEYGPNSDGSRHTLAGASWLMRRSARARGGPSVQIRRRQRGGPAVVADLAKNGERSAALRLGLARQRSHAGSRGVRQGHGVHASRRLTANDASSPTAVGASQAYIASISTRYFS